MSIGLNKSLQLFVLVGSKITAEARGSNLSLTIAEGLLVGRQLL